MKKQANGEKSNYKVYYLEKSFLAVSFFEFPKQFCNEIFHSHFFFAKCDLKKIYGVDINILDQIFWL